MSNAKKMSLTAFILMILTSVFGVTNIGIAFHRMGYAAIPLFILSGLFFFLPFISMMVEFGGGFSDKASGMYTWMEKSVSVKFAFVGIFMWYASIIVWFFGKCFSIWLPTSYMLFGEDRTANPIMVGNIDLSTLILGCAGIILVLAISALIKNGAGKLSKIASLGGISVIVLNIILLIGGIAVFLKNGCELSYPLNMDTLTTSPNPSYQSIVPFLGFVVFTVFAYGGVEVMAGIGDDLENPARDLKKGIFISGILIIVAYVIGFLMVGAIMDWKEFPTTPFSSLSALFMIMENLGNEISGPGLGQALVRFTGLSMFLCYLGAMIANGYAALQQLIGDTPSAFWPQSFSVKNENGILAKAIDAQALLIVCFIVIKIVTSFISPDGSAKLFDLIITMTNVSITLPYLFLIYAWYKFRNDDSLKKGNIIFKSKGAVLFATISTFILVVFGNVFTIIEPFIPAVRGVGESPSIDINTGIWTILGPVIFSVAALIIYNKKKDLI